MSAATALRRGAAAIPSLGARQELGTLADRLLSCASAGPSHAEPIKNLALPSFARQLVRGLSSKPPRKGWEKFYPKGKPQRSKGNQSKGTEKNSHNPDGMQPVAPTMQSLILTVLLSTGMFLATIGRPNAQEISFHQLKTDLLQTSLVERLEVVNKDMVKVYLRRKPRPTPQAEGEMEFEGSEPVQTLPAVYKFYFYIGSVDLFERQLEEAQLNLGRKPEEFVPVTFVTQWNIAQELLSLAPMLLIFGAFMWFNRGSMGAFTGSGGGGRNLFNVGKAQVKVLDKNAKDKVTFKDVAGCDEAKVEIMEFVSFLKAPTKYRELGARIPKGALLVGPPGTGKTLLAKATAGEANVPFLSISGSDFIEMFVGIGPARVRDLFTQAKAQSPSIVFIDEIDAIGRSRGRGGFAGSNDERESTLNQLLVEMDGFSSSSGVVVLAGTNRPDVLDKALLRAGRFDRQISLDKPDIRGREQIFRVHLAKIKLSRPLEYFSERLGALTPGFAGADIANVCNEAALIAARSGKSSVDLSDFEAAVDRVIGGLEKANKVISKEERRTVAYHESGHAVVSWFLEHAEPLMKVSIVPRGTAALGFAQYLPNENLLATTEQLTDMACVALGGRAAEEVLIGRISTGAQNDLERVTKMAHAQVGIYGMNGRVGLVSYPQDDNAFSRPYSEATAQLMDEEVRALVDRAYARTVQMVKEKRHLVSSMAEALLEREVLNLEDVEGLLGPRPFKSEELRNIDRYRKGLQAAAPTTEGAAGPHSSQRALDNSKPSSGPSTAEDSGATDVDPEAPTEVGEQVGCGDGSGAGCSGVGAAGESEAGRCQGGRGRRTAAS